MTNTDKQIRAGRILSRFHRTHSCDAATELAVAAHVQGLTDRQHFDIRTALLAHARHCTCQIGAAAEALVYG